MNRVLKGLGKGLGILLLGVVILLAYWYLRPNRTQANSDVVVESWAITNADRHNSNTDMILWNGETYIAYVTSPYHFSNEVKHLQIE